MAEFLGRFSPLDDLSNPGRVLPQIGWIGRVFSTIMRCAGRAAGEAASSTDFIGLSWC